MCTPIPLAASPDDITYITQNPRMSELRTIGIGDHNIEGDITENDLRNESDLQQRAAHSN